MIAIRRFPQAEEDLIEIWVRIASDSPARADRYLDILEAKMRLLATAPAMGRLRPELGDRLRVFPVDAYLIVFRLVGQAVEIVRVLHGARNIESIFCDDSA